MKRLALIPVILIALATASCSKQVPTDAFLGAVIDCAKVNPQASAALGQIETCLMSAIAGNPGACLLGLVTEAHFTVDEVACVVAWYAQQEQAKVAASTASQQDFAIRDAASRWLAQERIGIRNTYTP